MTFGVSLAVLVVVVALLLAQLGRDAPPAPAVAIVEGEVDRQGDVFHVPVDVGNDGERAAANVQVLAELVGPEGAEMSDQTIDFLGAGESERLVFVFTTDPADGDLSVVVGGFTVP